MRQFRISVSISQVPAKYHGKHGLIKTIIHSFRGSLESRSENQNHCDGRRGEGGERRGGGNWQQRETS